MRKARKLILLFAGQGSHHPEMFTGFDHHYMVHPVTRQVLGTNFVDRLREGPEPLPTSFTQPLIVMHSLALYNTFFETLLEGQATAITRACVLGHSLGEYSALASLNMLKFEEILPLVQQRGQLMEQEVQKIGKKTAMKAIINAPNFNYDQFLARQQDLICDLANVNSPEQFVLSGIESDVTEAISRLKTHFGDEWKKTRVIPLKNVAAPFHCRLMKPVSKALAPQLEKLLRNRMTQVPIVMNYDAKPTTDTDEIIDCLIQQTHSTVRWNESVHNAMNMLNNSLFPQTLVHVIEFGPSQVLLPLFKKSFPTLSSPEANVRTDFVGTLTDAKRLATMLAEELNLHHVNVEKT
jgi:malonyl CoA-acyl carrier protein transacylase